jgi:hypothetical protein
MELKGAGVRGFRQFSSLFREKVATLEGRMKNRQRTSIKVDEYRLRILRLGDQLRTGLRLGMSRAGTLLTMFFFLCSS